MQRKHVFPWRLLLLHQESCFLLLWFTIESSYGTLRFLESQKEQNMEIQSNGWFDAKHFKKWFFQIIVLSWAKNLSGPKCIIGDNLSSHVNVTVIKACKKKHDHRFVFPHLPLIYANPVHFSLFFREKKKKKKWRAILTDMKKPSSKMLEKCAFRRLLAKLFSALDEEQKMKENIISGWKKCCIVPFNPDEVYPWIPENKDATATIVRGSDSLFNYHQACHRNHSQNSQKKIRQRIDAASGEAIGESHLMEKDQPLPERSITVGCLGKGRTVKGKVITAVINQIAHFPSMTHRIQNPSKV